MSILACLLAGGVLGTLFFGGLWLTIRFALARANPAPWLIVSSMLRTAALLAALYLICRIDQLGLIAALAGFLLVRVAATRGKSSMCRQRPPRGLKHQIGPSTHPGTGSAPAPQAAEKRAKTPLLARLHAGPGRRPGSSVSC